MIPALIKFNTPARVQDFLNGIPFNFERVGETLMSPARVLRERKAHCLEGALFAVSALAQAGFQVGLMHLKATKPDYDHVVAVFKVRGLYGAISKTNHVVLRYREPIYKNIRELAMSYFHEYFLNSNGRKTLRAYSDILYPNKFPKISGGWEVSQKDLWPIDRALDKIKHHAIAPASALRHLRPAEPIERKAGKIVEYKNGK